MYRKCTNCIIPAIIPTSAADALTLSESLTFAPLVQIDVVDGTFAEPASWPYTPAGEPSELVALCERFDVQVDLMAVDPVAAAEAWVAAGAKELVVHLESIADLDPVKALRQRAGIELWLAGADTLPVSHYLEHRADIDGVQLMGISEIGTQGQPPSPHVLENIAMLKEADESLLIQIDGSVNAETIGALCNAGASSFVVGSAIVGQADPRTAYQALRGLVCPQ
jgi:ribulose-phosphate 3-epimerase